MTQTAEPTFAQDLQKLEKQIRDLESGRLDLDEALARFEEGIALTRKLRAKLDEAEGRIEQLLDDGGTRALDAE
ncbi:MAG TPA: exodeoxyribonuclease VII small subunit [Candidatus Thermoplasmatota archaeon]|nr:exodeoxyribonuclease VII small subunit [Candidatus Thermoplasmatota archaeon]